MVHLDPSWFEAAGTEAGWFDRMQVDCWGPVMATSLKSLLLRLLSGDTDALPALAQVSQDKLLEAGNGVELLVRRESVAEVLRKLSNRSIDGKAAQAWASFIRRGYAQGQHLGKGIMPLSIDYEAAHEDAIVEIISRLDQVGDSVDGDIPDENETELLLYSLGFLR